MFQHECLSSVLLYAAYINTRLRPVHTQLPGLLTSNYLDSAVYSSPSIVKVDLIEVASLFGAGSGDLTEELEISKRRTARLFLYQVVSLLPERSWAGWSMHIVVPDAISLDPAQNAVKGVFNSLIKPVPKYTSCRPQTSHLYTFRSPALLTMEYRKGSPPDLPFRSLSHSALHIIKTIILISS
jgi:hypothetical protein